MVISFAIVKKSCALFCVIGVLFTEIALKFISHHNFGQVFPVILISVAFSIPVQKSEFIISYANLDSFREPHLLNTFATYVHFCLCALQEMLLPYINIILLISSSFAMVDIPLVKPTRLRLSISKAETSLSSGIPSPQWRIQLKTPWIKDYLSFNSISALSTQNIDKEKPLKSTIISYEDSQADENDLRSWTRYIVQSDGEDDEFHDTHENNVVELDVDKFIKYLVEHKNFKAEDLQFLRKPDLDYGYDQIEDELAKIKRDEKQPHTISIGGEDAVGRANSDFPHKSVLSFSILMSFLALY